MTRITVVNDNPDFLELVRDILEDARYTTTTVDSDGEGAVERIRASRPELLVIDLRMGSDKLHGWTIVEAIRADAEFSGLPVLICSADLPALAAMTEIAERAGRTATLAKPFTIDELTAAIDGLLAESGGG